MVESKKKKLLHARESSYSDVDLRLPWQPEPTNVAEVRGLDKHGECDEKNAEMTVVSTVFNLSYFR